MPTARRLATPTNQQQRRRTLLKLAAAGGGLVAALRLPRGADAASGDSFLLGRINDAGPDQTALAARHDGAAALVITNTSPLGVGLRATNSGGYGMWGVGSLAGVRGTGEAAGVTGEANGTAGIGIVARRGSRSGNLPTNTGLLGFAAFGTGVLGEGGGATGVRGFASQYDGTSGPVGVGVQGVGSVGVLAQTGFGTGLRAIATSSGRAIEAVGPVVVSGSTTLNGSTTVNGRSTLNGATTVSGVLTVQGQVNASSTIVGHGSSVGVAGRSERGGVGIKGIAPEDGLAVLALGDTRIEGDLVVTGGRVVGNGSGLRSVPAESLTGTISPDRLSTAFARRDRFNIFGKIAEFRSVVRLEDRLISRVAGKATIRSGETFVDVKLPSQVQLEAESVVIATPQQSLRGIGFYARPTGERSIRISLERPARDAVAFAYLVMN